jgi:4-amino-4-deoxy-L-arabinose transferase-like glycosyltransferase
VTSSASKKQIRYLPPAIFLLAVALRLPFISKLVFHHDSVNFALALDSYNLRVHQPHPPGYFLYVMLCKAVHIIIADPNLALVSISIVFTSLSVMFIYLLAKQMYDFPTALIAALLALTSPNLWFHSEVALSYSAEAFFSTLIGFLCWKIYRGRHDLVWTCALALGLAGGFRQNTLVFLLPLFVLAAWRVGIRRSAAALILIAAVCAVWFAGMVGMTGGMEIYTAAFGELWQYNTGHNSVFDKGWHNFRLFSEALGTFTLYGLGAGLAVIGTALYATARRGELSAICRGKRLFYAAWILPSCLFYQFIFIHPANPGYALIFLPPLLILCARATLRLAEMAGAISAGKWAAWLTAGVMAGNAAIFLGSETLISWRTIRKHDRELALVVKAFTSFDPNDTAIVLKPSVFYGFRMIMYYLPQYTVYNEENKEAVDAGVKQTFWGTGRRTYLSHRIVLPANLNKVATLRVGESEEAGGLKVSGVEGMRIQSGPAALMLRDGVAKSQ